MRGPPKVFLMLRLPILRVAPLCFIDWAEHRQFNNVVLEEQEAFIL